MVSSKIPPRKIWLRSEVKIWRSHLRALLTRMKGAMVVIYQSLVKVFSRRDGNSQELLLFMCSQSQGLLAVWGQLPNKEMKKMLTENYTGPLGAQVGKEYKGTWVEHCWCNIGAWGCTIASACIWIYLSLTLHHHGRGRVSTLSLVPPLFSGTWGISFHFYIKLLEEGLWFLKILCLKWKSVSILVHSIMG